MRCHEILDFGRRRRTQMVAADEVRREIVFCRIAAGRAIRFRPIGGHDVVGRDARSGRRFCSTTDFGVREGTSLNGRVLEVPKSSCSGRNPTRLGSGQ